MKVRPVIYKFQKEALDYAANELADSGIGGIARFNDLFCQRFSELIIQECINKIEEVNNRHTDNYIDAALRDAAFEIETHFGVTE